MKTLLTACLVIFITQIALPIPPQINYQSYLTRTDGSALDTTVAMTFRIYDIAVGGNMLWMETHPSVVVTNGLFHVLLGSVSPLNDLFSANRWLEIQVGSDLEMTPRQQIVSVAYSYRVGTVNGASGGTISGKLNVGAGNTNSGSYAFVVGMNNSASGNYSSVAGGMDNYADNIYATVGGGHFNVASGSYATVGGGDMHTASGSYATVGGGAGNFASNIRTTVGGGESNWASSGYATVGGGLDNTASGGKATVGGGWGNTASGGKATVGGGDGNTAGGNDATTVGGGWGNTASGPNATVGGGYNNNASGESSTVGGGSNNVASELFATVGGGVWNVSSGGTVSGGISNTASGGHSMIPGGSNNRVDGNYSFAAGYRARVDADHDGSFVWSSTSSGADSTASFGAYTFTARCEGGARFYTAQTGTATGVQLSAGGGSWSSLCDVRQKDVHGDVNTSDVLQKVSALPLHRWSYKTQDAGIQHIGPTAQDFRAAFGLGESDTTINTLDPDGISLAAIQELAKQNENLRTELEAERTAVRRYEDQLNALTARVQTLEADQQETSNKGR